MDGRTEGREKQKGGILKEVGMKTEEEVKVAMEEGRTGGGRRIFSSR